MNLAVRIKYRVNNSSETKELKNAEQIVCFLLDSLRSLCALTEGISSANLVAAIVLPEKIPICLIIDLMMLKNLDIKRGG